MMPLSELYCMAKGKNESTQQKNTNCSTDLSFISDSDCVELVWEKGQILLQGQSSRARKTSNSDTFKSRDKDIGNGINLKIGTMDSNLNDFPLSVPSGEMGLSQDDDMVPWLNYHINDSLQQDCYSDFLTGLSGVTENELSTSQCNFASMEKRSSFNQPIRDAQSACCGDLSGIQSSSGGCSSIKMQKQDPGLPNYSSGTMNFSYFSRPAAMIKANRHNIGAVADPSLPSVERIGCKDKGSVASSGNLAEITLIDSNNGFSNGPHKGMSSNSKPIMASSNVGTKSSMAKPVIDPYPAEQSDALCHEDASKNDITQSRAVGSNAYKGIKDGERTIEAAVASSSVCSASSVDRTSNDPTDDLKRKCRDTEVSDCPSDDVEEESVGAKRAAPARGGSGSKRSRAAEVHNLSERRRRDRINEKMRALQELIPNCNKVDKASMLDEAIEYLKTLQLQVQIMSMGAGLYMPPMMLPAGMQHMHAAHMAHLSPMGGGMGMGFGISMVDVNGGSPGYPIMQVPPMQGVHFRGPPISGPSSLHAMTGSNLQMFGIASQGHPMSMPHSPMIPLPEGPVRNLNSDQASSSKDPIQNTNLQVMQNTDANRFMNQIASQETNEGFEQSALVLKRDESADGNGSAARNSIGLK